MRLKHFAACLLALCATQVWADVEGTIRESLGKLDVTVPANGISETPISGLYQVQLDSGRVLYASADGRYVVQGSLFELAAGQPRNLTAEAEAKAIGERLDRIPTSELVVFAPKEPKTHVTIFTDVDCGYCRKLHSEIDELNALGVEVRYAAFPRSGMGTPVANTMQSIWCAEDRLQAMTDAKLGKPVTPAQCDNPVRQQFELGREIGVQGTPAIYLANGTLVPGYKPAQVLAAEALENK